MLTAGLLLALSPALLQQAEGNASIQKDAAFALALTKQLGFDNFSEIVLEETLQRADTPEDRSSILLARCEVMSTVALRPIDPLEQVTAWSKAGEAYSEFLGSNPGPTAERRAQLQMGLVGFQYGERLHALGARRLALCPVSPCGLGLLVDGNAHFLSPTRRSSPQSNQCRR